MRSSHDMPLMARAVSWPARVLYGLAFAALLVIGFFFLTVALVAGALIALAFLARLWWHSRKLHHAREPSAMEGEFAVIERPEAVRRIETAPPPR